MEKTNLKLLNLELTKTRVIKNDLKKKKTTDNFHEFYFLILNTNNLTKQK
jgi:hypothetical protein